MADRIDSSHDTLTQFSVSEPAPGYWLVATTPAVTTEALGVGRRQLPHQMPPPIEDVEEFRILGGQFRVA